MDNDLLWIRKLITTRDKLSVDIDLTYLPLTGRNESLNEIKKILERIKSGLNKGNPSRLDQRNTMENHFAGMARESFTYEDFESTREKLILIIKSILTKEDKKFLLSFKAGEPDWSLDSFSEFRNYPAINWKLHNIRFFKASSPNKHQQYFDLLKWELDDGK